MHVVSPRRLLLGSMAVFCVHIALSAAPKPVAAQHEDKFKPVFDGKTLTGWKGDLRYWSVKDGAIVGNTKPGGIRRNTFLIADGDYADFVLRAKVKLVNGASGIQFRSRLLSEETEDQFRVKGYQADIDYGGSMGEFYEEQGRSVLQPADPKVVSQHVRKGDWNTFEIQMVGREGVIKVNGHITARYTEKEPKSPRSGLIALQLQTGAMEIAFQDIEIREISGTEPSCSDP